MRKRAPAVNEWAARLWNIAPEVFENAPTTEGLPSLLEPLFAAVADVYLPYLTANAAAHAAGKKRVSYDVQGVRFTEPVKPYRVWCLEQLRRQLLALDRTAQDVVQDAMGCEHAFNVLTQSHEGDAPAGLGDLPIDPARRKKPVDSWWRGR